MMNCKQACILISDVLDNKLGLLQRAKLRIHLMRCAECKAYDKNMRILRAGCRILIVQEPD